MEDCLAEGLAIRRGTIVYPFEKCLRVQLFISQTVSLAKESIFPCHLHGLG